MMKKIEYKAVSIKKGTFTSGDKYAAQIEADLNVNGAQGWELIEISGNISLEGFVVQIFKRELKQE